MDKELSPTSGSKLWTVKTNSIVIHIGQEGSQGRNNIEWWREEEMINHWEDTYKLVSGCGHMDGIIWSSLKKGKAKAYLFLWEGR